MADFLATCLQAAVPIWLAAIGALFAQRSGVTHLGLEGLMLSGAFVAVAVAVETGSISLALLVALGVNGVLSVVFWTLVTHFQANVMMVGLGLSLTAVGATGYGLVAVFGSQSAVHSDVGLPRPLASFGGPVEHLSILTLVVAPLAAVSWWVLQRTRFGIRLRASGSDPFAARSAGVDVDRHRLAALQITGAFCTLAGAELALGSVRAFADNMTAGRGYLAFAAVLLGAVRVGGVSAASVFFGVAAGVGIQSQLDFGDLLPPQFVLMLPYVATIVAIAGSAYVRQRRGGQPTPTFEVQS